ncbi:MAG: hypothetical protein ACP5XB_02510 [Isosphaeraceae bacterium]
MNTFRERDIRIAIHDLLEQTDAFDGVYLTGLPEARGEPADDAQAVSIEPSKTTSSDVSDDDNGDLLLTCQVDLVFLARHENPWVRDENVERLLNVAADALSGQSLGGATIPAKTRIVAWTWQKPAAPERRITAALQFQYLVAGWTGFNTDE